MRRKSSATANFLKIRTTTSSGRDGMISINFVVDRCGHWQKSNRIFVGIFPPKGEQRNLQQLSTMLFTVQRMHYHFFCFFDCGAAIGTGLHQRSHQPYQSRCRPFWSILRSRPKQRFTGIQIQMFFPFILIPDMDCTRSS